MIEPLLEAERLPVELLGLIKRGGVHLRNVFLGRGDVTGVALRKGIDLAVECGKGNLGRLTLLLLDPGEIFLLEQVKLFIRERGFAQDFGH